MGVSWLQGGTGDSPPGSDAGTILTSVFTVANACAATHVAEGVHGGAAMAIVGALVNGVVTATTNPSTPPGAVMAAVAVAQLLGVAHVGSDAGAAIVTRGAAV